ncbi:THO complex subunit 4A-like [Zingiber officinale]|uniref:THO complex subunit 4A-like n=1 Tax=Zingiber officinale TaxID=94328 RepID=UPI001C4B9896|nr:THO complex subunit 4A-like [Zingiber officinale]XP_042461477.1 THO complex subunit 4A-like [Zingiber officinale]
MSGALDMSLDDIIKNNKKTNGGGRGRGRGSGPGPSRRFPNRATNRSAPYSVGKAPESAWQHDMYSAAPPGGFPVPTAKASSIETGTKLYISNLEYGVSNEDIKELFSEVGDIKRYSINYDRSGRSKGTAEVVFAKRTDALAAVKRYNNVLLDGKPMNIEIIGTNIPTPAVVPQPSNGVMGNPIGGLRSGTIRGSAGWPRAGGRGRGRGRGRGKGRGEPVSADALDADLDKYHSEAMQTN